MAAIHLNMTFKTLDQLNRLEEMAIFDALTGVFNRRKFDIQLSHEVSRTRRNPEATLSCGFIDLDNFKQINDSFGHQVGDTVLKVVAQAISETLRDYDICARYGGDEFVMLLPDHDTLSGNSLETIGLRILEKTHALRVPLHPQLRISVSIGIATQNSETVEASALLKLTDEALYAAKRAGKNCLHIHSGN